MEQVSSQPKPRKRKVDWLMVMRLIDELPEGEAALVGEFGPVGEDSYPQGTNLLP